MAPKRKADEASNDAAQDESSTILYGKDAFWLKGLVGKSPNDSRDLMGNGPVPPRDPAVAAYTDEQLCDAAFKVAYLLDNNLTPKMEYDVFKWLGIHPTSDTCALLCKGMRYEQGKWEKRILNFALQHVGKSIKRYQAENKGKKLHE